MILDRRQPRQMQLSGVTDRRDSHLFNAMVFMADSERAADLAKENGLDVRLHLILPTGSLVDASHQSLQTIITK